MTVPKDGPMTEATERDLWKACEPLFSLLKTIVQGWHHDHLMPRHPPTLGVTLQTTTGQVYAIVDALAGYARRTEATGEARAVAERLVHGDPAWDPMNSTAHLRVVSKIATALTESARAAEERERERCAKIAESYVLRIGHPEVDKFARNVAENIARIIRTPRTEEGR